MSFSSYDFSETIRGEAIDRESIKRVIAAHGVSSDGRCEWSGGFLFEMKDGRFCYVSGWCDTTGWGCRDGTEIRWFDSEPEIGTFDQQGSKAEWETTLPDLQKYIETGEGEWE